MNLHELNQPIRRGLARLRRRARSILGVLGASRTLLVALVALVCFFFADYMLRLPLEVRRILALLLFAGLVAAILRHLFLPLSRRMSDAMLALRVESAYPDLENRLSSSLAFAESVDDPENEDSPQLMRAVVQETAGLVGTIRFASVARGERALRWSAAAIGLLAVVSFATASHADIVATFVQRSLLLRDIAWPRRTTLTVEDMRPGEARLVTRGREATILIRAEGSLPDQVLFTFWEKGASRRSIEEIELTPSGEDPSLFAVNLPVYASYEFMVSGGDDDRELVYEVRALTPPAILGIEMEVDYPAYLELEPASLEGGDQRVPAGSRITLRVVANMDLGKATVTFIGSGPVALERRAPDAGRSRYPFETTLVARKDLRYSVRLRGPNGEENDPVADTFILRVLKDQAPTLRVRTPSTRTGRVPGGFVIFAFNARDDYEIKAARFRYRINEGEERLVPLGESGGDTIRILTSNTREKAFLPLLAVIDIAHLRTDDDTPLAKGDQVTCTVEATDSAGQTQAARGTYRIDVIDEDARNIMARQNSLRDSVDRSGQHAGIAAADMEEVRAQRGRDPTGFRRWTGRAQAAQARVLSDLDSLARAIREVFNLYVFNRLDGGTAADQMIPYYERHLLGSARSAVTFPGTLYSDLWRAQNEKEIRARGGLAKLLEMAELSNRLATRHAPAAYKAIARIGSLRGEPLDAAVEQAVAEQKAISQGLAQLERLMSEWQSYEGVVRFFEDLRQRERDFKEKLEGIRPESEGD